MTTKRVYKVYLVKGDCAEFCTDTPKCRGLAYALSIAGAYMRKESADGYQVLTPSGSMLQGDGL